MIATSSLDPMHLDRTRGLRSRLLFHVSLQIPHNVETRESGCFRSPILIVLVFKGIMKYWYLREL